jgi:hypothetical protein
MAITGTVAAVASAGAAVSSARTQSRNASMARGMARTVFDEQQDYARQLSELIKNPSKVTELPGYDFQFSQGQRAIERTSAARFGPGSGTGAAALTKFGQGLASSFYKQQTELLASLSGLNVNPSSGVATATAADAAGFDQLGQALASIGYSIGNTDFGRGTGGSRVGSSQLNSEINSWAGIGKISVPTTGIPQWGKH